MSMDNEEKGNLTGSSFKKPLHSNYYGSSILLHLTNPEYIHQQKGNIEMFYKIIGMSCLAGSGIGSIIGMHTGFKKTISNNLSPYKKTILINNVIKNSSRFGNAFGTIAVYYTCFNVLLQNTCKSEDKFNTIAAGTGTGLLYKSLDGMKKCSAAGLIGFGITTAYCLIKNDI